MKIIKTVELFDYDYSTPSNAIKMACKDYPEIKKAYDESEYFELIEVTTANSAGNTLCVAYVTFEYGES
jgi:formaldehyde-activating enzyme involved in methanogenesis